MGPIIKKLITVLILLFINIKTKQPFSLVLYLDAEIKNACRSKQKGAFMKNKIISILLLFMAGIICISCDGGDINLVKNGAMNFDKSTTIGKVFSSYPYFSNREWKSFEDTQGRKIVEFTADVNFEGLMGEENVERLKTMDNDDQLEFSKVFVSLENPENSINKEYPEFTFFSPRSLNEFHYLCSMVIDKADNITDNDFPLYKTFYDFFDYEGNIIAGGIFLPVEVNILKAIKDNDIEEAAKYAKQGINLRERFYLDFDRTSSSLTIQFTILPEKKFNLTYAGFKHNVVLKGFDGVFTNSEDSEITSIIQNIYKGMPLFG